MFSFENSILVGPENKISAKFIKKPISETVVNISKKSTKKHQKCAKVVEKRSIKWKPDIFGKKYFTVS